MYNNVWRSAHQTRPSAKYRIKRTYLDVPPLMLERHRQHPADVPIERASSSSDILIEPYQPRTYAVAERQNIAKRGPIFVFLRDFRVALSTCR